MKDDSNVDSKIPAFSGNFAWLRLDRRRSAGRLELLQGTFRLILLLSGFQNQKVTLP
jgi:hypothetical protein